MKSKLNLTRIGLCLTIACIAGFASCKKETSQTSPLSSTTFADVSTESAITADLVADDIFSNVVGINEDLAFGQTGVFSRVSSRDSATNHCFSVQVLRLDSSRLFPVKTIIDFGTGCTDNRGVTRKGKIITIFSGSLQVPGNSAQTGFENYYINDMHVEGKHEIDNISSAQLLVFNVTIADGKIARSNGNYTMLNSNYTVSQTSGLGTPAWLKDDELSIEGEANGAVKNDSVYLQWNSKIAEPLIKKFTCQWISKGKVELGKANTGKVIIDYGDGDCDNKASLIINDVTREITLH
jgi:hypothetical protein